MPTFSPKRTYRVVSAARGQNVVERSHYSSTMSMINQWRIQDFPGGALTPKGGANFSKCIIWPNVPKTLLAMIALSAVQFLMCTDIY